jgi:hypothetical protein
MKTSSRNLIIAMFLFDFIIEFISASLISSLNLITAPNFTSIVNFNNSYIRAQSITGTGGFFGFFTGIIDAFIALIFFIADFFTYVGSFFTFIYNIMTLPFTYLPTILADFLSVIFITPIIISIVFGIQFLSSKLGSGDD